jgi:hypothetical protein
VPKGTELDEETLLVRLQNQISALSKEFATTAHFKNLTASQQNEAGFVIESFAEYAYEYGGALPEDWSASVVAHCCKETLVRKISAEDEYYESVAPVLSAFFLFCQEKGVIRNAAVLTECLRKVAPVMIKRSKDSENWGPAKHFVMGALQAGVDPTNEAEMNRYIAKMQQEALVQVDAPKIKKSNERNMPCPCGSGKKFKKCCWAIL